MKQVSRDPFARTTLYREIIPTAKVCDWCGNARTTKKGSKYLYQYSVEEDGLYTRREPFKGLFCSIGCMRAHNGG